MTAADGTDDPTGGGVPLRLAHSNVKASVLLVLSAALAALVPYLHLPSALREVAVLGYCLSIPGWAIVRFLRLKSPELVVSLSVAISVAMFILISVVMVDANLWHAYGAFDLVLAITALAGLLEIVLL